jgi:hypothetical protein
MESIESLQETEMECLRRFRAKAAEIRAANPMMTAQVAFVKAVESLPRTADRYQSARMMLQWRGIEALPLR